MQNQSQEQIQEQIQAQRQLQEICGRTLFALERLNSFEMSPSVPTNQRGGKINPNSYEAIHKPDTNQYTAEVEEMLETFGSGLRIYTRKHAQSRDESLRCVQGNLSQHDFSQISGDKAKFYLNQLMITLQDENFRVPNYVSSEGSKPSMGDVINAVSKIKHGYDGEPHPGPQPQQNGFQQNGLQPQQNGFQQNGPQPQHNRFQQNGPQHQQNGFQQNGFQQNGFQ